MGKIMLYINIILSAQNLIQIKMLKLFKVSLMLILPLSLNFFYLLLRTKEILFKLD